MRFLRSCSKLILIISVGIWLAACGGGGGTPANQAPTATGVGITDNDGGDVVALDTLTGNYTYSDADNDAEGTTTFRWLADGLPINNATMSTFNVRHSDSGKQITFEVTPVAATGVATGAPVVSPGMLVINSAPFTIGARITDDNGGDALIGDSLTGDYIYQDAENDAEGTTTFRWLRNNVAIPGATSTTYTLVAADDLTTITFEVTPIALTGIIDGIPDDAFIRTGTPPVVSGIARYRDVNRNGVNDSNDQLIVPFDQTVIVVGAGVVDFSFPVTGDTLGTNISVASGPAPNEVTITLGTPQKFKSRGNFTGSTSVNSSSGIDVSNILPGSGGPIQGLSSINARTSTAIDIMPDFVDSGQSLETSTTDASLRMATGDINGDGAIDMVVANGTEQLAVYTNNGSGLFGLFDSKNTTDDTRNVALGDVDGDGDLDMVTANNGPNRVWLNNTNSGFFQDSGQSLGNNNSWSVALGDVDGDGDLDIVVGNFLAGYRVWLNSDITPGIFSELGQPFANATYVALGDVDGDGDLDIAAANPGVQNRILLNNDITPGVFTDSGQLLGINESHSATLGDVDGDGDLDMVVANRGDNRIWLNSNTKPGDFTDSGQSLGTNFSFSADLGDIDGDGDLDMVVANSSQGDNIWLNNSVGVFTDSGLSLGASAGRDTALGDVDGDGDLDMLVANLNQGNQVYMNSLTGTWGNSTFFETTQVMLSGATRSVAFGDIDNDGDLDMVAANFGDTNTLGKNNGTTILAEENWGNVSNSSSLALGDLDGDGYLDIALANENQGNEIWLNDRAGAFIDTAQSLGTNDSRAVALGDIDSDGDLDLVVANFQQPNRVWRNNGNGGFTALSQPGLNLNNNSQDIVLGDIDVDGDLDMVVANATNGVEVYLNSNVTPGIFANSGLALGPVDSRSVALGDVDGDGGLDIVVANLRGNRVYKNGNSFSRGTFTDSGQSLGSNASTSVALADTDGDGDLDMIVGNIFDNLIWLNDGNGGFTDSGKIVGTVVSSPSYAVSTGDFDGDGDLDIAVGNNPTRNQIYLNE